MTSQPAISYVHPSDRSYRIGRGRHIAPRALLRAARGSVEGRLVTGLTAGGLVAFVADLMGAF